MRAKIYLSGHLKTFTGGETEITIDGTHTDVGELLESLWRKHRALHDRIIDERGEIRTHVNIFHDGTDIRRLSGLQTGVAPEAELHIFNAVSGG